MALRPTRDLTISTSRADERRLELEAARAVWAEVDAHISDALGEGSTIPSIDLEADP